jgi:hypothetical protein
MLCLPSYVYVISSTKLVVRAKQDLSGTWEEEGRREGDRVEK